MCPWVAIWLGVAVAMMLLPGCASVPADPNAPREARQAADNADPERRAKVRLELAGLYYARGQIDTALSEVNQAISAKPDMGEAYSLRGLIYAGLGEARLAEQNFQRALQINPRDADAMHNFGWVQCQAQRFVEANALFEQALAQPQYRDPVRTLLSQGVCHARAGNWVDAERALSRSYELNPASPVAAFNLSEVLLKRGEVTRARFYVARINAQPDLSNAQSLWLAARIEQRGGNPGAAQDFGRQLRDRFPQSPEALQFERGRFDD
ncbi:MAG: type IV pilus biogenesis/stability protein PilW [Chitinophagaceae bacterium]|nr:type IV pilus biogenesis/stability protein PilW [Rubrivivax sp.]